LRPTPNRAIGFFPIFSDDRIHPYDVTTTPEVFDDLVDGVDRVYVVHANNARALGHGNFQPKPIAEYLFALAVELTYRGFAPDSKMTIGTGEVDIWRRTAR
jgi:hypothetical protein